LDGKIIPADLPASRRHEIRKLMEQHNLEIIGLGASTRFSSPDPEERQHNLKQLHLYLELAHDLRARMVRTFGGNIQEGCSLENTIAWVSDSLAEAVPVAEREGVIVALETHDDFSRGTVVAQVLERVPNSWLSVIWDVHHPYRMGESLEETWHHIGSRTAHVHIKDARRQPDGSWQLVLLGEGEVPCQQVINLLRQRGYSGYLSVEWEKKWHPEIEEPEIALPQHARLLQEWLSQSIADQA
jgi:sugar phosphate isomerase/epimerase